MARVKELVLIKYAEALHKICVGINETKPYLHDIEEYLSMETYVSILNALGKLVNDAYYEGNEEKAGYYIDKCEALTREMRIFNRNFGL